MKKRWFGVLLAFVLVLTLLPTALAAEDSLIEGGTYYFDLSGEDIPGTVNNSLPDKSLHYVPFTYVGTINAYKLTQTKVITENEANKEAYDHSLFIADYMVKHTVSWDTLNGEYLIFGKSYTSGGVGYTLRAPSVGNDVTGTGDSISGTPANNEWDTILNKNSGYIKNWTGILSIGQDTSSYNQDQERRMYRGCESARNVRYNSSGYENSAAGFRPVLEVLNPDTLGSGALKVVTLDLAHAPLSGSSEIKIVVKNDSEFTAPASEGLTVPAGHTLKWRGSDGNAYAPGDSVSANVTKLTAEVPPNTYNISYKLNGGTNHADNPDTYTYGAGVPELKAPTKTGYDFLGWYSNNTKVTSIGQTETGSKSFTAKWQARTYTVSLNANGGTIAAGKDVTQYTYGIGATLPTDVTKTGYDFLGWYSGDALVTAIGTSETGAKSFTAKWQASTYTVSLNANGGTINSDNVTSYTYGVGATLPTNVTKTGYDFLGWYSGDTKVTAIGTAETGAKSFTAKWQASTYTVSLNANGGTINSGNITSYTYGVGATLPTNVTKTGYDFLGWYSGDTKVTAIGTAETGAKSFTAKWQAQDRPVAVYAVLDGTAEAQPIKTLPTKYDEQILPALNQLTAAELDHYGYDRASGFFDETGAPLTAAALAQDHAKVYVRYTAKLFTVTFRSNGGSSVAAQQVRYLRTASRPADPKREGYTFLGWVDESGRSFSFRTAITADLTLTAQWKLLPNDRLQAIAALLNTETELPFYDVSTNDWFYASVRSAWEQELFDGVSAQYFKPNSTLTVAQAVKLAAALHQKQSVGFVSLQNGGAHWYDNYVNYAVTNGLIESAYQSKDAAAMNAPVTRAEFVHILSKLCPSQTINTVTRIPDVASGDAHADEIYAFYRAGILTGSDRQYITLS